MKNVITPTILTICAIACKGDTIFPGTQVGTEESLFCTLTSSETIYNLNEIPDGLIRSPREVIDSLTGTFFGPQLDENEAPTSDTVTLTVSDPDSIVTVSYYGSGEEDVDYTTDPCPPHYTFELHFTMDADGFPSFDGTLEASYTDDSDGNTWAESFDESLFNAELPAPVTFNPDDWDTVEPHLVFSGAYGYGWYTTLTWLATPDVPEGATSSAGEAEILFLAALTEV